MKWIKYLLTALTGSFYSNVTLKYHFRVVIHKFTSFPFSLKKEGSACGAQTTPVELEDTQVVVV